MAVTDKQYLGDSVYVEFADWQIVLTTEDGFGPSNTIILESEVWRALQRYVQRIEEEH